MALLGCRIILFLLTVVIVLVVSLPRLHVALPGGDAGELMACCKNLFLAHPPGYPLYVVLCHYVSPLLGSFLSCLNSFRVVSTNDNNGIEVHLWWHIKGMHALSAVLHSLAASAVALTLYEACGFLTLTGKFGRGKTLCFRTSSTVASCAPIPTYGCGNSTVRSTADDSSTTSSLQSPASQSPPSTIRTLPTGNGSVSRRRGGSLTSTSTSPGKRQHFVIHSNSSPTTTNVTTQHVVGKSNTSGNRSTLVGQYQKVSLTCVCALCGVLWALTPSTFQYGTETEVFALNNLIVAVTLLIWVKVEVHLFMLRTVLPASTSGWSTPQVVGITSLPKDVPAPCDIDSLDFPGNNNNINIRSISRPVTSLQYPQHPLPWYHLCAWVLVAAVGMAHQHAILFLAIPLAAWMIKSYLTLRPQQNNHSHYSLQTITNTPPANPLRGSVLRRLVVALVVSLALCILLYTIPVRYVLYHDHVASWGFDATAAAARAKASGQSNSSVVLSVRSILGHFMRGHYGSFHLYSGGTFAVVFSLEALVSRMGVAMWWLLNNAPLGLSYTCPVYAILLCVVLTDLPRHVFNTLNKRDSIVNSASANRLTMLFTVRIVRLSLLLSFLSILLFNLFANLDVTTEPVTVHVYHRFWLQSLLPLTIAVGMSLIYFLVGFHAILTFIFTSFSKRQQLLSVTVMALCAGLLLALAVNILPVTSQMSHDVWDSYYSTAAKTSENGYDERNSVSRADQEAVKWVLHHLAVETIRAFPQGAVFIAIGDQHLTMMRYAQWVLGLRLDVVYVDHELAQHYWYRQALLGRHQGLPRHFQSPLVRPLVTTFADHYNIRRGDSENRRALYVIEDPALSSQSGKDQWKIHYTPVFELYGGMNSDGTRRERSSVDSAASGAPFVYRIVPLPERQAMVCAPASTEEAQRRYLSIRRRSWFYRLGKDRTLSLPLRSRAQWYLRRYFPWEAVAFQYYASVEKNRLLALAVRLEYNCEVSPQKKLSEKKQEQGQHHQEASELEFLLPFLLKESKIVLNETLFTFGLYNTAVKPFLQTLIQVQEKMMQNPN